MGLATVMTCVFLIGNQPLLYPSSCLPPSRLVGRGSLPDCVSVTPELQLTFRDLLGLTPVGLGLAPDFGTVQPYNPVNLGL
jgi:hypothetical protein